MILMVGSIDIILLSLSPLTLSLALSLVRRGSRLFVRPSYALTRNGSIIPSSLLGRFAFRSVIAIGIMDTFAMTDHIFFGI